MNAPDAGELLRLSTSIRTNIEHMKARSSPILSTLQ